MDGLVGAASSQVDEQTDRQVNQPDDILVVDGGIRLMLFDDQLRIGVQPLTFDVVLSRLPRA